MSKKTTIVMRRLILQLYKKMFADNVQASRSAERVKAQNMYIHRQETKLI